MAKAQPKSAKKNTKPKEDPDADLLETFEEGKVIFEEGDAGDRMYIVADGEIEISKQFGPRERELATLEAGAFFGEMAVLEGTPRNATARAKTDCRVLPLDVSTFEHMVREHPASLVRIVRELARRLRDYEEADRRAQKAAAGVLGGVAVDRTSLEPIVAPSLTPPKAVLVHVGGGSVFHLNPAAPTLIGRLDPTTQKAPEIDLTQIDTQRSMSRRHAAIFYRDGRFWVREQPGVANGTYLEGQRISNDRDHEIRHGQRLKLAMVEMELRVS